MPGFFRWAEHLKPLGFIEALLKQEKQWLMKLQPLLHSAGNPYNFPRDAVIFGIVVRVTANISAWESF
jgi:hypothetical protein